MEKIIRWFVSNKVVSNLLMVLILVPGATTIPNLKMEVFPEIELKIPTPFWSRVEAPREALRVRVTSQVSHQLFNVFH